MASETKIELKYRPKSVWFFRYGVTFLWNSWVAFSFSQEGKLVGFCDVHAKPIISKHRISLGRYHIKPKEPPLRSSYAAQAWTCLTRMLACLINRKINERLLSTVVKVGFTAEEEVEIYENPLLYQKKAIILTVTVLHYAPVQKELLTQQLNQEVSRTLFLSTYWIMAVEIIQPHAFTIMLMSFGSYPFSVYVWTTE